MAISSTKIKRELYVPIELDRLIQAPLNDPALSLPKGIRGDFILNLLEENLEKWYDLCYGAEYGTKALEFERLNQSQDKVIQLQLFEDGLE